MGLKKATPKQAYLKMALYGRPGSGKTLTSLIIGEGLAKKYNKRIAFFDTESGTDFYAKEIKQRTFHPEAFDFDVMHSRSLTEVIDELNALDFNEYGIIIVDSITHLWEAAKNAYQGKKVGEDNIPLQAWNKIKKPYKTMLINFLMSCPAHVFMCGREGMETEIVDGSLTPIGTKMKAEGETQYEPHICINMKQIRRTDVAAGVEKGNIVAYFEKDRTGVFNCQSIKYPKYEDFLPLVELLDGKEQRKIESDIEAEEKDSNLLNAIDKEKIENSAKLRSEWERLMRASVDSEQLKIAWKAVKVSKLTPEDKEAVVAYKDAMKLEIMNTQMGEK